jgi:hypothetical protein
VRQLYLIINHQLTQSGIITDKNLLPITQLNFGGTLTENSSSQHTLGRFECTGQVVDGRSTPSKELGRSIIQNNLNGLQSAVMGANKIDCDFEKFQQSKTQDYLP